MFQFELNYKQNPVSLWSNTVNICYAKTLSIYFSKKYRVFPDIEQNSYYSNILDLIDGEAHETDWKSSEI